jgi:carotenoid cleavage dioxygenase-like enzyme
MQRFLSNDIHELPRINESYDGKQYRFYYASDIRKTAIKLQPRMR